jgi:DNA-binding transcriptional regulator YiaG
MTPEEVRRARKALGLSQSRFAALLGVHVVTVKKWETGAQGLRATSERLIRLLVEQKMAARRKATLERRRRARREGR